MSRTSGGFETDLMGVWDWEFGGGETYSPECSEVIAKAVVRCSALSGLVQLQTSVPWWYVLVGGDGWW